MLDALTGGDKGSIKECLLCQRILQELLPLEEEFASSTVKMLDKIPSVHHLQLFKVLNLFDLNSEVWIQYKTAKLCVPVNKIPVALYSLRVENAYTDCV